MAVEKYRLIKTPKKYHIMKTLNRLHKIISIFLFGNKSCMPNELKSFR